MSIIAYTGDLYSYDIVFNKRLVFAIAQEMIRQDSYPPVQHLVLNNSIYDLEI